MRSGVDEDSLKTEERYEEAYHNERDDEEPHSPEQTVVVLTDVWNDNISRGGKRYTPQPMTTEQLLVLDQRAHAIPVKEYVDELESRLPDWEITLARTPAAEREEIANATIATGIRLGDDLLCHAKQLRYFACGAAGVDHLPLDRLEERGIAVSNASGVHGPNMAEHVIGWLLMFTRRLDDAVRRTDRGIWQRFQSHELQGSTVTIVGLGAIGQAITERLEGFSVDTIGVRYTPEKGGPTDEVIGFDPDPFHEALARTDFLVLACPLTETTRGLIGAEELRVLPPDTVLVNVGRGPLVDTDALVRSLRRNELRGVGLDVTHPEPLPADHPLWQFDNIQITTHSSGHTPEYWSRLADIVAENVRRIDRTGRYDDLENQVVIPSS